MKKYALLLLSLYTLASCGSLRNLQADERKADKDNGIISLSKEADETNEHLQSLTKNTREHMEGIPDPSINWEHPALPSIIGTAKSYLGTRYRYGGTTAEGMDCSGLVCTAFAAQDIALPRISADIAAIGTELTLEEIGPGDLVFFHTTRRNRITHVGLVITREDGDILFIHASTSSGVILSKLSEPYWQRNFVVAKRVL